MFKIYGDRPELWQWDLGQKLIVEDANISEVHFHDGINSIALVCEVYELDGIRVVNIPNVVLQDNCDLKVFAFVKDNDGGFTKHGEVIKVNRRSRPADYVYTETEIKSYETLEEKINDAIANIPDEMITEEKVKELINDELDLTNYLTKEETSNMIKSSAQIYTLMYMRFPEEGGKVYINEENQNIVDKIFAYYKQTLSRDIYLVVCSSGEMLNGEVYFLGLHYITTSPDGQYTGLHFATISPPKKGGKNVMLVLSDMDYLANVEFSKNTYATIEYVDNLIGDINTELASLTEVAE